VYVFFAVGFVILFLFANLFVELLFLFPADSLLYFDAGLPFIFVVGCFSHFFGQLLFEFSNRLLVESSRRLLAILSDSVS
jgi:hypothetical protein